MRRLYAIFKDADALDRVRLGIDSIDVYYLRHEQSLKFFLVAQRLLEKIY